MLVTEGFTVGITTVKEAVVEWRRRRREVFVPLVYPAAIWRRSTFSRCSSTSLAKRVKAWMFVMRLKGPISHRSAK
jgi:hypothetical protein